MSLDIDLINANHCDKVRVKILDSVDYSACEWFMTNAQGRTNSGAFSDSAIIDIEDDELSDAAFNFFSENGAAAEAVVLSVEYLVGGAVVGSSLVQNGSCELKLLKYKVELPRGAKVTLFDDAAIEAKFLAWNLPCPTTLQNMTFLQVKATNGFEQQLTPSAGSQTIELYTELGRRYANFGEIWTYSFAQTLWFADLRVQLSDNTWQDCTPVAGEGETIVTTLPQ